MNLSFAVLICVFVSICAAQRPQDYLCKNVAAVLMFDTSQSITPANFQKMIKYAQGLVSSFSVGAGPSQAQFGGVLFNEKVKAQWSLSQHTNLQDLQSWIAQQPYTVGTTNFELAFETTYKILSKSSSSCKAVILFTDGWADGGSSEQSWASRIRNTMHAKIISIAVEGVNGYLEPFSRAALQTLSGSPQYVFELNKLQPDY